jgi:hypothetical protein
VEHPAKDIDAITAVAMLVKTVRRVETLMA